MQKTLMKLVVNADDDKILGESSCLFFSFWACVSYVLERRCACRRRATPTIAKILGAFYASALEGRMCLQRH